MRVQQVEDKRDYKGSAARRCSEGQSGQALDKGGDQVGLEMSRAKERVDELEKSMAVGHLMRVYNHVRSFQQRSSRHCNPVDNCCSLRLGVGTTQRVATVGVYITSCRYASILLLDVLSIGAFDFGRRKMVWQHSC